MKKNDSLNVPHKQQPVPNSPIKSNQALGFWLCAGLLCLLLASTLARDINRPVNGLHSWAEAHGDWLARVHLKYGLGYTKGLSTWAVGDPPTENPKRYLDHPQLHAFLNVPVMYVLGINNWSLRVANLIATVITLLLFLKILYGLFDDKTALLAGLFFCLFPIIGYFGVNKWLYPFAPWGIWNYLVLIKGLKRGPEPKRLHRISLAVCLFVSLLISWEGFFFALAFGVHYVFRCIIRKQLPEKTLLAILIIAPIAGLMVDFAIMAIGYGDYHKIIDLLKWRAGSGEMKEHDWGKWFTRAWEHGATNFTIPVLITTILYLTIGQLIVFMDNTSEKLSSKTSRRFGHFWLFFMIPVFQLFILKGALWPHQTWERPFVFLIAIATAQAVLLIRDLIKKANKRLANVATVALICVLFVFCTAGTNHYYGIRWQSPEKVKMFHMLKEKIPPDKSLLSFEDFIVNQHEAKGPFYRPEVAWYLDREIVQARSLPEIQNYAQTGRFPYYLIPAVNELAPLINSLAKKYTFERVQGDPGQTKSGRFYRASMPDYLIFDLNSSIGGPKLP